MYFQFYLLGILHNCIGIIIQISSYSFSRQISNRFIRYSQIQFSIITEQVDVMWRQVPWCIVLIFCDQAMSLFSQIIINEYSIYLKLFYWSRGQTDAFSHQLNVQSLTVTVSNTCITYSKIIQCSYTLDYFLLLQLLCIIQDVIRGGESASLSISQISKQMQC